MRRAGRIFLALIVGVLGVEIGLRLFLGLGSPPLFIADEDIGYLYRADQDLVRFTNRVHINQYHQRSEDVTPSDSSRVVRVLFLGDSITWGGVLTDQSETYPELFEARLDDQCNRPAEVLNASAGTWGIGNLRAYTERFGYFGSDLVVIQVGEDDLVQPTSDSSQVGHLCSQPRRPPTLALQEFIICYAPRIVNRIEPWLPLAAAEKRATPNKRSEASSSEREQFEKNMTHLGALVDSVRATGKPLVVIYVPERSHVLSGNEPPPPHYHWFRRWIERHEIPMLDLQTRWEGAPVVERYYRDYLHPNERGNKALAKSLSRFVHSREISPCR
jgi:lysophospholipase L1-like esterase